MKQLLVTHCAGKDLRVGKQKYSKEFKQAAVERMRSCGHIVALAAELGVRDGNYTDGATSWTQKNRRLTS